MSVLIVKQLIIRTTPGRTLGEIIIIILHMYTAQGYSSTVQSLETVDTPLLRRCNRFYAFLMMVSL
jgi:hypothetical protein